MSPSSKSKRRTNKPAPASGQDKWFRILDHRHTYWEFTAQGLLVLVVTVAYNIHIGAMIMTNLCNGGTK
jgi:hypothetical protein